MESAHPLGRIDLGIARIAVTVDRFADIGLLVLQPA
jgi:hypothetical protein